MRMLGLMKLTRGGKIKMETQSESLAELEVSEMYENILNLIKNNPRINLRNLVRLSNYSPQDVWSSLVELKERKIILLSRNY
jgi:hypothetical protein